MHSIKTHYLFTMANERQRNWDVPTDLLIGKKPIIGFDYGIWGQSNNGIY